MPDACSWTCGSLASRLGGVLSGDEHVPITGVQTVGDAGEGDITFVTDRIHAAEWPSSAATAVIVSRSVQLPDDPHRRPIITVDDATLASFEVLKIFAPTESRPAAGIDDRAMIDPTALIGANAAVAGDVSVGPRSRIGDRTVLHSGVRIGADVQIGSDCVLHGNVVIRDRVHVGSRVILHQNASIGADGFGYRPAPDGSGLRKAPHIGTVVIEDDVEIGANSCVDRAKMGATVIGAGTKVDNLVQIGHNCRIGRSCVIAAQSGLSGSVTLGDGVMIGGQVGVADHVTIASGARIAAQSGIMRDVEPEAAMMGYPAVSMREFLRMHAVLRTLSDSPGRGRRGRREDAEGT